MSWWRKDDGDADEDGGGENVEGEEEEDEDYKDKEDRLIFLIDCRASMLQQNSSGQSHLQNVLQLLLAVMKSKIISNESMSLGVICFGTREKDGSDAPEGVYTLFTLTALTASRIKQLQTIVDDLITFENLIGSQDDGDLCPLRDALWTCINSFSSHRKTAAIRARELRRIWIFTNNDNPFSEHPQEREQVVKICKDCGQNAVEISLWHIGRTFNPALFYTKVLLASSVQQEGEDEESLQDRIEAAGDEGFHVDQITMRRKKFKKRILTRTLVSLGSRAGGEKAVIAVKIYKLINIFKRPTHVWLEKESGERAITQTRYIDSSTGKHLDESEISFYVDAGGNGKVSMSKEAFDAARKTFTDADEEIGIVILYFIPQASLAVHLNVGGGPYFFFPDDERVQGSSGFLHKLIQDLTNKKLVAIVSFRRVKGSPPMLAALLPQKEEVDEGGCQLVAEGLHLLPLPYCDDMRTNPNPTLPSLVASNDAIVAQGSKLLQSYLQSLEFAEDFQYSVKIENPAVQRYFSVLQAAALSADGQVHAEELGWDPSKDDTLQPDDEKLAAEAESLQNFQTHFGLSNEDVEAAASKRKAPSSSAQSKRAKADDAQNISTYQLDEYRDMIANGSLDKLTIPKLKEICGALGLPVSGTKGVLLDRIKGKVASP